MNEYNFEFHNVSRALVFVNILASTMDVKEFSITGMERAKYDILAAAENWNIKVWIKTTMSLQDIKDVCKILRFYDSIDFGGDDDAAK